MFHSSVLSVSALFKYRVHVYLPSLLELVILHRVAWLEFVHLRALSLRVVMVYCVSIYFSSFFVRKSPSFKVILGHCPLLRSLCILLLRQVVTELTQIVVRRFFLCNTFGLLSVWLTIFIERLAGNCDIHLVFSCFFIFTTTCHFQL
jgi:hypothetical protein